MGKEGCARFYISSVLPQYAMLAVKASEHILSWMFLFIIFDKSLNLLFILKCVLYLKILIILHTLMLDANESSITGLI